MKYTIYFFLRRLSQIITLIFFCCLPWLYTKDFNLIRGNLFSLDFINIPFVDPANSLQVSIFSLIYGGLPGIKILIGTGLVLLIAFLFGRVFCSFICPYGFFSELIHKKNIVDKPESESKNTFLYKLIIFICILLITGFFSYPLLTIFSMPGSMTTAPFQFWAIADGGIIACIITLIFPIIILVFESYIQKRIWCRFICPQSVMLGLFSKILPSKYLGLRISWNKNACSCKKENPCRNACSLALNPRKLTGPERRDCVLCGDCLKECSKHGRALQLHILPKERINHEDKPMDSPGIR